MSHESASACGAAYLQAHARAAPLAEQMCNVSHATGTTTYLYTQLSTLSCILDVCSGLWQMHTSVQTIERQTRGTT